MTLHRLSPTTLSQYVRLENCERYLRFCLVLEDMKRLSKKWGITIQPLTPLLKEAGADFEQDVASKLAARGETMIDLQEKDFAETLKWFRQATTPVILIQPALEAPIGNYYCNGRADVVRISRDRQNRLQVLIADIKATRAEKTEHRLQVATYARLVKHMAQENDLPLADLQGAVITIREDGNYPTLGPAAPTFELDTYFSILDRLVTAEDSVVNKVVHQSFEDAFYNLNYKCDGCLYNALCMYDSAERLDISLTPFINAVEKRVLHEVGIKTLPQLAVLMLLPKQGDRELQPNPSQKEKIESLKNRWPVAPRLPILVQRARASLRRFDPKIDYQPFLYGSGFGTLPSEQMYPDLIKIFFDAQRDYLQDRLYLISGLISGPKGELSVVSCAESIPTDEVETQILVDWVTRVIMSLRVVAAGDHAPIHLYCYNRYDQKVLLEALKRNLNVVAAIPAFFDLMTQSPALSQPMISFLADEVQERLNLGLVCAPLHDVARRLGFDWKDDRYEYYALFRARMFDNRRSVVRAADGSILADQGHEIDPSHKITIEAASRFNSQIPLEYAYAAWRLLPESKEDSRLLDPFRKVDRDALISFAGMRVKALAHIEGYFKTKSRSVHKEPIYLPHITQDNNQMNLARSLCEFIYMEHHTNLQANLLNYSLPVERRVQNGLTMLLSLKRDLGNDLYEFTPEFTKLGLDPELTMNACKLKEGDWVVFNPADDNLSANQIKHGRLAIIKAMEREVVKLHLLEITFSNGTFRYYHNKALRPIFGQFYMIDPMVDDLNADKILQALANSAENVLYHWLLNKPPIKGADPRLEEFFDRFTDLIDALLKNRGRKLTQRQRETIAKQFDKPLVLIQGPPGTGKSYTLAWAILARIAANAIQGKPCRVLICCKTHNAVNVALKALTEVQQQIQIFAPSQMGGDGLRNMEIYKVVNDPDDVVAPGAKAIRPYEERYLLGSLFQKPYIAFGSTSGGAYNLMRYRSGRGRSVDWESKPFDLIVIDEASQMNVPEGVLAGAFLRPSGSMIVVGDHRQMPPILIHEWKEEQKRSVVENRPFISLFEFLIERDFPQVKLDESFRLHEQLAEFLRLTIYAKDGINFHSRRRDLINKFPSLAPYTDVVLRPEYPIVVIEHSEQSSQQFNEVEIKLTRPLIDACVKHLGLDGKNGIGIVVPHRAQRALLRTAFPMLAEVNSIDTVERFQGDERDVIIVSATASDPDYVLNQADFLLNLNRLNVAISRPRKKLVVIASRSVINLLTSNLDIFEQSAIWKKLYYHYTPEALGDFTVNGYRVIVRGRKG